jgi:hypothetical protein
MLHNAQQCDTLKGNGGPIMATRKVKNDYIGGRADSDLKEQIEEYIDVAEITMGTLIRKSVVEYMKNHPIKEEA